MRSEPCVLTRSFTIASGFLVVAGIYFFVTAPPPLAQARERKDTIPIEVALSVINAENDAARALYASEIVGAGKAAGLAFDERWREPEIIAGPLPALFLRETARHLEMLPVPLGLFLGSDRPINPANDFAGPQVDAFSRLRETRAPVSFHSAELGRHFSMFPDVATVEACVRCHNEHPSSPTTTWALGDVMGAVTWSHPESELSTAELLTTLKALRSSILASYGRVLDEFSTLPTPPEVGTRWPRDGFYLPSKEVFEEELDRRASSGTMRFLLNRGGAADES